MTPRLLPAVFMILMACNHRAPVYPEEAGIVGIDGGLDTLLLPDGQPDLGVPEICRQEQVPWTLHKDPRGNFGLVIPSGVSAHTVSIAGAASSESAVALNASGVAALVATRLTDLTSPAAEVSKIQQQLSAALTGLGSSATVRAAGSSGSSAEKHPDVKEVIWDVSAGAAMEPGELRNRLFAVLLAKPLTALSGLPGAVAAPSAKLMIKLALALRPTGQIIVSAAVANQADYDDTSTGLSFLVDDLGNGTAVAQAGTSPVFECDIRAISSKAVADIIWIVDESGSMNDNRQDIVNNVTTFFNKALAAGLDFRMGVAGMKKPGAGVLLGKFCSDGNGASSDDGGEDRFLLPDEKDAFTACVKNPPYYEGGSEHGLSHGYWAVKNHLPRAASSSHKIREGAHLAVIFVTDETAQELTEEEGDFFGEPGFLSYMDYKKTNCQLTPDKQVKLETFIQPLVDLFGGAQATVHLIGGVCNNACSAEVAFGYQELVNAFGGQTGDVCQHDLNATLQVIIDTITASASPRTLKYVPISSTLAVEANGLLLPRSRTQGWVYNPTSNSLTFINVQVPKGAVVVASYQRFN
jgi:hypothetical protein